MHIPNENYAFYSVKPNGPAQHFQIGYSEEALTEDINDSINSFSNFLLVQMFHSAAPENVHCLISHKDQTRLTIDNT